MHTAAHLGHLFAVHDEGNAVAQQVFFLTERQPLKDQHGRRSQHGPDPIQMLFHRVYGIELACRINENRFFAVKRDSFYVVTCKNIVWQRLHFIILAINGLDPENVHQIFHCQSSFYNSVLYYNTIQVISQ